MTQPSRHADDSAPVVPDTPSAAGQVFGDRLDLAERYVALLADTGISHGLIGPREAPRLWSRHVLGCAAVSELIPAADGLTTVIDVGSGAGLPGICLAISRPDLEVHLVEPLARRTTWLREAVTELGLTNVVVHTARAESLWGELSAPFVTARAVAKLEQLATWTLPLLTAGGSVLALKGERAQAELVDARPALRRLGVTRSDVALVGLDLVAGPESNDDAIALTQALEEPVRVVRLGIDHHVDLRAFKRRSASSSGSARRRADRRRENRGGRENHARQDRADTPDLPEGDRR